MISASICFLPPLLPQSPLLISFLFQIRLVELNCRYLSTSCLPASYALITPLTLFALILEECAPGLTRVQLQIRQGCVIDVESANLIHMFLSVTTILHINYGNPIEYGHHRQLKAQEWL